MKQCAPPSLAQPTQLWLVPGGQMIRDNSSNLTDFSRSGSGAPFLSQQWYQKKWSGHEVSSGLKKLKSVPTSRRFSNDLRMDFLSSFHWLGYIHIPSLTSCSSTSVGEMCRADPGHTLNWSLRLSIPASGCGHPFAVAWISGSIRRYTSSPLLLYHGNSLFLT